MAGASWKWFGADQSKDWLQKHFLLLDVTMPKHLKRNDAGF